MPREVVHWFAEIMEQKLQENDHKGGWADNSNHYLLGRLREEVNELTDALYLATHNGITGQEITREAADVANIAMMIADNAQNGANNA